MHSNNEQVIRALHNQIQNNQLCWLISIAATWGSSPRPAGSLLLWSQQQGAIGSLSGGCVEEELLHQLAQGAFAINKVHLQRYGISAEEASRLRLPCGGSMELVLEPIAPTPDNRLQTQMMVEWLDSRQGFTRQTCLQSGEVTLGHATPQSAQLHDNQFTNYLGPKYRLLLVGANQVAEHLALYAQPLDFEILVCDPRPNAFQHWPHDFTQNLTDMPDDAVREWAHDPLSAVVTLSHDPRVDDMALMEALTTDGFYIGAMGSTRSTEARKKRLAQLDLSEQQIAKLHAPVGIAIGSKTPAEIALSIAADLVRNRGNNRQ